MEKTENFSERLYSFQNFYFAGIHAGIQTAHTIARMSQKYAMTEGFVNLSSDHILEAGELFHNWARRGGGETIIVKNGGMQGDLIELLQFLDSTEHPFPYDYFNESQYAANRAMTNVSIVLPERIWKLSDALRRNKLDDYFAVNTGGKTSYLVDAETYAPVRLDADHELTMQHRSFEKNALPLINWNAVSDAYDREMAGHFVTPTPFELELVERMNRSGLM